MDGETTVKMFRLVHDALENLNSRIQVLEAWEGLAVGDIDDAIVELEHHVINYEYALGLRDDV